MSRIGKAPIAIPAGVTISVSDKNVVTVKEEDGNILVTRPTEQKRHKSLHGLYRSLINNMVVGVTEGYKTTQELVGVGYRASSTGNTLELALGFSHPIVFVLPAEVKVSTTAEKGKNPTVTLESSDKQLIGQIAAKIRSFRKPEPYKGKGVKFAGEQLRRKAGKSAKK
jgi:large subunit ribosomal protein L6